MLAGGLALVVVLFLAVAGSILLARHVARRKRYGDKYIRYGTDLLPTNIDAFIYLRDEALYGNRSVRHLDALTFCLPTLPSDRLWLCQWCVKYNKNQII